MKRTSARVAATAFATLFTGTFLTALTASPASAAPACAFVSGTGIQEVEAQFAWTQCAEGTPYRVGNLSFGQTHIESGGSTGNEESHQTTAYAQALWQEALSKPPVLATVDDYYKHSTYYTTPGGEGRTMCVIVDGVDRDGVGQKGIITAYYAVGIDDCLQET